MSKLWHIDVEFLMETYGIRRFVETGTGIGQSLAYACKMPFLSLWSCEIERSIIMEAVEKVADDARVALFIGTSVQMLGLLPNLPVDEPILFWLDAHFPGADYGLHNYDYEKDLAIRLPLIEELTLIREHRPRNADVIVIDDARIWLDGPFEKELVWPFRSLCSADTRGIDFIHERFAATHDIAILRKQEGKIMLTPMAQ